MTLVTGIVVNFRTPGLTVRAATSLLDDGADEVIIVENGSGDGSEAQLRAFVARTPGTRLTVSRENLGFGRGANLGAGGAKGAWLFLLNSDATLAPGCLGQLVDAAAPELRVGVVAPQILGPDGVTQPDSHGVFPTLRTLALRTNRHPPDIDSPDWVSGVAMLVRREAFEQVGGFDDRFFMYFEDIDLCQRLRSSGYDVRRARLATVVHDHQASKESVRKFLNQYYRSQDAYLACAGWPTWKRWVVRCLRYPVRAARMAAALRSGAG